METIRATPSPEQTGQRLDKAAAELFGLSRSSVQELLSGGRVLVNGKEAKPACQLKVGDVLTIEFGSRPLKIRVKELKEVVRKEQAEELYEVIE